MYDLYGFVAAPRGSMPYAWIYGFSTAVGDSVPTTAHIESKPQPKPSRANSCLNSLGLPKG